MAEKSFSFVVRKRLPDLLRDRPQGIDDGAPIAAGFCRSAEFGANQTQEAANCARTSFIPELWPKMLRRVGLRQKAAAREHVNVPGEALRFKRDGDVDAGETGADQKNTAILGYVFECGRRPRVGRVARAVVGEPGDFDIGGRKISDGEHEGLRHESCAVGELDIDLRRNLRWVP